MKDEILEKVMDQQSRIIKAATKFSDIIEKIEEMLGIKFECTGLNSFCSNPEDDEDGIIYGISCDPTFNTSDITITVSNIGENLGDGFLFINADTLDYTETLHNIDIDHKHQIQSLIDLLIDAIRSMRDVDEEKEKTEGSTEPNNDATSVTEEDET